MNKFCLTLLSAFLAFFANAQTQITNLPTIYINTENGAEITSKEDYVPTTVQIVSDNEEYAVEAKTAGIRGRGNSTWNMPKKPYRIKFDKKIALFNRPANAKNWVLLANYADKTLMRNGVAFEISRFIGMPFSPTAEFVDVVLNGEYLGNYMVSDQMQVNPGRVEIDEMTAEDIDGEALTGGYFLEIDGFGDSEPVHFHTDHGMTITVKSPDDDVIVPAQLSYITNFINSFEDRLFSNDFADEEKGYRAMVDEETLINWYIACELTGNSDSFWSTYIYKKRGEDKIYFGPLWDYDIAFNNDNRLGDAVSKLMRNDAHDNKTWIKRMWEDQWFRTAVYNRWKELVAAGIEEHLLNYITNTAQMLDESQKKNFNKWRVLSQRVYLETFLFDTYTGGVDYLKEYVSKRISFLSESFKATGIVSEIDKIKDGARYYMIQYNGLYATPEETNFYIENPDTARQALTFVKAGEGIWNIRTADGRLVASKNDGDKYCTYLTDGTDTHAQFVVEASQYVGYAKIKNLATNLYLGIENQAHWSRISTNKDGTSTNHAWKIIPADPEPDEPVVDPDEPVVDPDDPVVDPDEPVVDPDDPVVDPDDPVVDPDDPVVDPDDPVVDPDDPVVDPDDPVVDPDDPVVDPDDPVVDPDDPGDSDGVDSTAIEAAVRYDAASATIVTATDCHICVFTLDGRLVAETRCANSLFVGHLHAGCYIAIANGHPFKFLK